MIINIFLIVGGAWKYDQSDWFSLVMLSQQAQYFGRSVPDQFTSSRRRGLGTRLIYMCVYQNILTNYRPQICSNKSSS